MNRLPDLDSRLDEALEESFPASDPPAVHGDDPDTTAKPISPAVPPKPVPP